MKKTCLVFAAILAFANLKSQTYIQGGLNLANITKTNNGQTEKNNILPVLMPEY